jgi:hypothetical protein
MAHRFHGFAQIVLRGQALAGSKRGKFLMRCRILAHLPSPRPLPCAKGEGEPSYGLWLFRRCGAIAVVGCFWIPNRVLIICLR